METSPVLIYELNLIHIASFYRIILLPNDTWMQ